MKHGECVLHKVLNSYLILGFLRLPDFTLLTGLEDAESSRKQVGSFPLNRANGVGQKLVTASDVFAVRIAN